MEGKIDILDVSRIDANHNILIHAISQNVIPWVGKSKNPTFLEIFYCWCALESHS